MKPLDILVLVLWVLGFLSLGSTYSALSQNGLPKSEEVMQGLNLADGNGGQGGQLGMQSSVQRVDAVATDATTAAVATLDNATTSNSSSNLSNIANSEIFVLRTTGAAEPTTESEAETINSTTSRSMFGGLLKFSGGGLLGNLISGTTPATSSRLRSGRLRAGYGSGSGYGSYGKGVENSTGGLLSMFEIVTFAPTTERPQPPGNFDKHLDAIIVNLGKTLRKNGFDPIHIGNILQCSNCTLEGLSLIRRSGPSNFVYANRTVVVDAHLTLPALYIHCFPCVDVILMVPLSGMLEVALWGLKIYGKVSQPTTRGANPTLITYRVEHEGDLDISLNGQGLLAPITEFGFKVIRQRQVSDIIREFVYERVPKFLRRRLKDFSFPVGK